MDFSSASYASSSKDFSPGDSYFTGPVSTRPRSFSKRLTIVSPADAARAVTPLEAKFRELTIQWKAETRHLSSPTEVAMHPAYQRVIGLGPEVLPLIIAELIREPDWWFWALRAVSGRDPVADADRGRLAAMTHAWRVWWETEGLMGRWRA